MNITGKIVDSVVIVGALAVGYGAVKTVIAGVKSKNNTIIAFGVVTGLIALYAGKEAIQKVSE